MNAYLIPISLISLSALYAGVGLIIWGRRPALAVTPFTWMMFSVAVWTLGYGLEFLMPGLGEKILWSKIEFFGIASVAVFLFSFCAAYTGRENLLSTRNQILLWVVPSITYYNSNVVKSISSSNLEINIHKKFRFFIISGSRFWDMVLAAIGLFVYAYLSCGYLSDFRSGPFPPTI